MSLKVYFRSQDESYYATGVYTEEIFVVKKGSKINLSFADHIRGGNKAKSYREDPRVVDKDGNVLIDCEFGSPSTAAQFVTGRSTNGLTAWRVDSKTTLKAYLSK